MTKSLKITVDMEDVLRVLKYAQEHARIEIGIHFAPEDQQFIEDEELLTRVISALEDSDTGAVIKIRKKKQKQQKQKQKEIDEENSIDDDSDGSSDGSGEVGGD